MSTASGVQARTSAHTGLSPACLSLARLAMVKSRRPLLPAMQWAACITPALGSRCKHIAPMCELEPEEAVSSTLTARVVQAGSPVRGLAGPATRPAVPLSWVAVQRGRPVRVLPSGQLSAGGPHRGQQQPRQHADLPHSGALQLLPTPFGQAARRAPIGLRRQQGSAAAFQW